MHLYYQRDSLYKKNQTCVLEKNIQFTWNKAGALVSVPHGQCVPLKAASAHRTYQPDHKARHQAAAAVAAGKAEGEGEEGLAWPPPAAESRVQEEA
jgi:hypothetical protein